MLLCSKGVIFSKQSEIYILLSRCNLLWNIFSLVSLPSVQHLLRTHILGTVNDFKVCAVFQDVPRSCFSAVVRSSLTNQSSNLSLSRVVLQVTLGQTTGRAHVHRDCCGLLIRAAAPSSHLMGGLLYWCFSPVGCDPGEEQPWLPLHSGQSCE